MAIKSYLKVGKMKIRGGIPEVYMKIRTGKDCLSEISSSLNMYLYINVFNVNQYFLPRSCTK